MFVILTGMANYGKCDVLEVNGYIQYAPKYKLLCRGKDLSDGSLSRQTLKKYFSQEKSADVDIVVSKLSGETGGKHMFNLSTVSRFSLSKGEYRFECSKYDLAVAELYDTRGWCILADAVIQVASNSTVRKDDKVRRICIMCYEKGSRVAVRGRVVNSQGLPVGNIRVVGQPLTQSDCDYHKSIYKNTDENGFFEFDNQPPASLDIATYYLLTGARTSPLVECGDKVLDFRVTVKRGEDVTFTTIPLLSEFNFPLLHDMTERIKMFLPDKAICLMQQKKEEKPFLPVSTNNVIYVGDIVLPDRKQQVKD